MPKTPNGSREQHAPVGHNPENGKQFAGDVLVPFVAISIFGPAPPSPRKETLFQQEPPLPIVCCICCDSGPNQNRSRLMDYNQKAAASEIFSTLLLYSLGAYLEGGAEEKTEAAARLGFCLAICYVEFLWPHPIQS